jgi:outer membrane protein OmpA-like peptidoglycan-associated protein
MNILYRSIILQIFQKLIAFYIGNAAKQRVSGKNPVILYACCFIFISFYTGNVQAQSVEYFVVVGAFAQESNAKKFTGFVKRRFYQSSYTWNEARRLFYVHAWQGADKTEATKLAKELQLMPEFFDCWVYSKVLSSEPVIEPTPETVKPLDESMPLAEASEPINNTPTDSISTPAEAEPEPIVENLLTAPPVLTPPPTVRGKLFKFDVKTPDGQLLSAKVHHVNIKQGRDIAVYSSNDYADVLLPTDPSRNMTLVCGIFGYKEITQVLNYTNPAKVKGAKQDSTGAWIIPFQLERLKSGDYSIMYDVSFFKNSVAMQEKSKVDLDALLTMLQSNERLKIRIHGHVNGSKERAITNISAEGNYFEPEASTKSKASATQLSVWRAELVKKYLMDNGIAANRLDTRGNGGKAMIVSETHPAAHLNDRIEIQVLKD